MSRREDDAVAVGPCGGAGRVSEDVLPEGVGGWRESHGSTGVTAVCLFDGVDGEEADGVYRAPSDIAVVGGFGEGLGV